MGYNVGIVGDILMETMTYCPGPEVNYEKESGFSRGKARGAFCFVGCSLWIFSLGGVAVKNYGH